MGSVGIMLHTHTLSRAAGLKTALVDHSLAKVQPSGAESQGWHTEQVGPAGLAVPGDQAPGRK